MKITLQSFSLVAFLLTASLTQAKNFDDPSSYRASLGYLQNKVPLTYNESVKSFIQAYSTNQKKRFSLMLGLSKYYFPIYEKVFSQRNVPDELKYLSIVESSLNPQAVSRAEATGPWQFLYEVGKIYGLTINDTIDERKDPILACNAAASYLLDSYAMYGNDWLLAIASYNCGRNNIKWAMEESGGKKDYWSIRKYLPVETQNYVPAYIATVYLMNNYKKYGIYPIEPDFRTETESITVKQHVSIASIAQKVNISAGELFVLNPSFKKGVINGTPSSPKNLVIPVLPTFAYNAICSLAGAPLRVLPAQTPVIPAPPPVVYVIMYTAQPGDTLASIAAKFKGATEDNIKELNKLRDNIITEGMTLKIKQG